MSVAGDTRDAPSGTLERGLAIFEFFAVRGEAPAPAVADALGVSRSAAYRILDTLRDKGFLELNPVSQRLRLGIKVVELGMAALAGVDVSRLAPPYLQRLAELTAETALLAVMDSDSMVYLHQELGPRAVKLTGTPGSRHPLHCTSLGKAFMSAIPDDERHALIDRLDLRRFTDTTITDRAVLDAELIRTRERGYAIDNAEGEEGVACFGAPVFDHRGVPVAAISVSAPAERIAPNEERIGRLVAGTAADLSRRLGYSTGNTTTHGVYDKIMKEAEDSLRRLNADYIDLFQHHWPDIDDHAPVEETIRAQEDLVKAGKVRYIGVSNYQLPLLRQAIAAGHLTSVQPRYNILDRSAEAEILPFCREHGIGVVVYSPLEHGLLTGTITASTTLSDTDWRSRDFRFKGEGLRRNLAVVNRLRPIAAHLNCTMAELSLAWVLANPVITAAIVGVERKEDINRSLPAASLKLDPGSSKVHSWCVSM